VASVPAAVLQTLSGRPGLAPLQRKLRASRIGSRSGLEELPSTGGPNQRRRGSGTGCDKALTIEGIHLLWANRGVYISTCGESRRGRVKSSLEQEEEGSYLYNATGNATECVSCVSCVSCVMYACVCSSRLRDDTGQA
jgi:hypothetical protein